MKHQAPQKSRATESLTLPITGARRFQIARECRLVIKGPREHRMKLDGFGEIPFLHRRVDGPLNTMIPHDESRIDALHLAGNVRWWPALIAEAFTPARKPLLDDPR